MICPLDHRGYCGRHLRIHTGAEKTLAEERSDRAEQWRLEADRFPGLSKEAVAFGHRLAQMLLEQPAAAVATTPTGFRLGDAVASVLSAVGITKERVKAVVGKDCGCTARQEALNRVGDAIAGALGGG